MSKLPYTLALSGELAGDDAADAAVVGAVALGAVTDAADHPALHDQRGHDPLVLPHPPALGRRTGAKATVLNRSIGVWQQESSQRPQ